MILEVDPLRPTYLLNLSHQLQTLESVRSWGIHGADGSRSHGSPTDDSELLQRRTTAPADSDASRVPR